MGRPGGTQQRKRADQTTFITWVDRNNTPVPGCADVTTPNRWVHTLRYNRGVDKNGYLDPAMPNRETWSIMQRTVAG